MTNIRKIYAEINDELAVACAKVKLDLITKIFDEAKKI